MRRKKLLACFDYDNDQDIKTLFINQARHSKSPVDFWNSSVKENVDGDRKAKGKMNFRQVGDESVLCGTQTHTPENVEIELRLAKEPNKRVILLKGYREKYCTRPTSAGIFNQTYDWAQENPKSLIHGGR